MDNQFEPLSIEYSQAPFPFVVAVIAIPSTAPESTSVIRSPPALLMMLATVLPPFAVSSSVIVVKVIFPVLSSTGASFTAETVIEATSVAVLNAVVLPFVDASTLLPAAPLVWSQARNVISPSWRFDRWEQSELSRCYAKAGRCCLLLHQ